MASTRANPVFHGTTYHVAHRCIQQLRLLLPSKEVNLLLAFCLAEALRRTGVLLHGVCFHVNHEHLVITDPEANLPQFMQLLHSLIARSLNARFGRRGPVFDPSRPYVATPITTREQLLHYLAYTTTNPVKDGLVSGPERWPGFLTLPAQVGTTLRIRRPSSAFFGGNFKNNDSTSRPSNSSLPSVVALPISLPENFYELSELEQYRRDYQAAVDQAVVTHRAKHKRFMGPHAVKALPRFEGPAPSHEPVRTKRPSRVSGLLTKEEFQQWREGYVLAREAWGDDAVPKVNFPYGAWQLPTLYHAPVEKRPA